MPIKNVNKAEWFLNHSGIDTFIDEGILWVHCGNGINVQPSNDDINVFANEWDILIEKLRGKTK